MRPHLNRIVTVDKATLTDWQKLTGDEAAPAEEAKLLFTRIEECSIMTEEVRKTCQALKEKLVIGKPEGHQGTKPDKVEVRSA